MGGRGGSSGMLLSLKQERKLEDNAQRNDAKLNGYRLGARYFEYTDSNGKIYKGETGNIQASGGTYRATYSNEVAEYAKKPTSELEKERTKQKNISNEAYQAFTRVAASRSKSYIEKMSEADRKVKAISQILRRRKK